MYAIHSTMVLKGKQDIVGVTYIAYLIEEAVYKLLCTGIGRSCRIIRVIMKNTIIHLKLMHTQL